MSLRAQLILWYLGVLAALLVALGIFQSLILTNSLRSSLATGMRQTARAELAVLGPCYIRSAADLDSNAQSLALLLGSRETAVTIVTPAGRTLADHGLGPPGAMQPLQLSAPAIGGLIASAAADTPTASGSSTDRCRQPASAYGRGRRYGHGAGHSTPRFTVGSRNLLLLAVPLGSAGPIVGYAILGQSLDDTEATLRQVDVIFGIGAALALLIASLVALPLINRALAPLRRVTAVAESIAAGHLAQRANLPHSRDEIGRLGVTFDAMVDRLHDALSAATASEERMRQFLADASHELRTPVTVVRGASQVLLRQGVGEGTELAATLRDMHTEAVRLSRLVEDLLTLSRIDVERALTPEPVPLKPFLEDFVERYGVVWPSRTIAIDGASMDGATAQVDPEALRRVLTNLVDNAARYSRPDGAIVLGGGADADSVSISVSDEGPGLTPEESQRVFDRFYRANKSRSRESGGTGLGLAIVRGLAEQSGGEVGIETAPDRGTIVAVRLPRAR